MTMKKSKTLQHIAAVAVVLLALCLVFAAPVSAEGTGDSVAYIGQTGYETLQMAVNAATDGTPESPVLITLNDSDGDGEITGDGVIVNGQHIKIDFNQLRYNVTGALVGSSGTDTLCFQLLKGSTVILENGTVSASPTAYKPSSSEAGKASMLIQNYCNLTLKDMILDGRTLSNTGMQYALSNNCGNVLIQGNTIIYAGDGESSSNVAFDHWYGMYDVYNSGISVTFDESFTGLIDGTIEYGRDSNAADVDNWYALTSLTIRGNGKFTGNIVDSSDSGYGLEDFTNANIKIYGGYFTYDNTAQDFIVDGYCAVSSDVDGYNIKVEEKTWDFTISPNSHDFGSLEEGYETQPTDVQVTIQNTGNQDLQIESVTNTTNAFYYNDLVGTVITTGGYCEFNINANLGLLAGTYEDTVTIVANSTEKTINLKFVVNENQDGDAGDEEEGIITVTPPSIDLGGVVIGSFAYEEVTITNNGDSAISLEICEDTDQYGKFSVGGDGWTSIEAGETIALKIYANESLPVGEYSTEMEIRNSDSNELLFSVPITYTLVEGSGSSDEPTIPEAVEPSFDDSISEITENEGVITITFGNNQENVECYPVSEEITDPFVAIFDEEANAVMVLYTSSEISNSQPLTSIVVDEVYVVYDLEAEPKANSGISTVDFELDIALKTPDTPLPKINATFVEEKAAQITAEYTDHKPLAMLTAETNVDNINNNLTEQDDAVLIDFYILKSELDAVMGDGETLVGYHIHGDTVDKISATLDDELWYKSDDVDEEYPYYKITLIGTEFSTYAVGIAPPSGSGSGGNGSGSGSGSSGSGSTSGSGSGSSSSGSSSGSGSSGTSTVTPTVPPTEEPTDDPTDVPGEQVPETPVTPETPEEPSTPAPILAVLAGLGAAVVLRRK